MLFLNRCYRTMWSDPNGQALSALGAPAQYCISYGAEQIALSQDKPENMLMGFAQENGDWTVVKPTLDIASGRICGVTNQAAVWTALFAPASAPILLPTTGGNAVWWTIPLALFGMMLMLVALRIVRRKNAKV
jgi:hypothetical protein